MPRPCASWPSIARPTLIVTVDCGISAVREAELARELGVELIVTDHHTIGLALPRAAAIVHPRLPGGHDAGVDLCGAARRVQAGLAGLQELWRWQTGLAATSRVS